MKGGEALAFEEEVDGGGYGSWSGETGREGIGSDCRSRTIGLAVVDALGMRSEFKFINPVAGISGMLGHSMRLSQSMTVEAFSLRGDFRERGKCCQEGATGLLSLCD